MPLRQGGRRLQPAASGNSEVVEVKFLVDRETDTKLRARVLAQKTTRAAHLRKLVERDLKRASKS
jgi:hypothetical protein